MRKLRYIANDRCYHLISRLAHKAFLLTNKERDRAVDLMRRAEYFSGVTILAYAFMENHFHMLVYVPKSEPLDDAELLDRINRLYRGKTLLQILEKWERLKKQETEVYGSSSKSSQSPFAAFRDSFVKRMCNSAEFMRTFKQHLTASYNGRLEHTGTMWEGRYRERNFDFKTEDLWAVSAYIDMNPVKAGMVEHPEDYTWSSFAAACAGDEKARAAYALMYGNDSDWRQLKKAHEASMREIEVDRQGKNTDEEDFGSAKDDLKARILATLRDKPLSVSEIMAATGMKSRGYLTMKYLKPLIGEGLLQLTDPEHPSSPKQRYECKPIQYRV